MCDERKPASTAIAVVFASPRMLTNLTFQGFGMDIEPEVANISTFNLEGNMLWV